MNRAILGMARLGALIAITCLAQAADVNLSASLDHERVALNEQAVLSITVSGAGSNLPEPQMPPLPDFQVYNAGRAQNFTWINGQASASVTYQYVLTPLKEGHFTIPPIHIQGSGASETPELTLDVVKGNPAAVAAVPTPSTPDERPSDSRHGTPALFITGTVDKESVYVGEPVVYTFRLYNRVPLLSHPNYQPPETSGFWAEDLPPQRNYTTTFKGVPYNVTEVKQALFPTTAGTVHIGSAQLTVHLENLGGDPMSPDFFAQFFGRGEEKTLHTEPVSVRAKALPVPKPEGFKGAVGQYAVSSSVDKQTVQAGQPMTLTVTVSGKGNIKSIPDMTLPEITGFRTFDANAATNIEKKDYTVAGSKVFKIVAIPTVSGNYQIPSLPFVYFDPERGSYRTVSTHAFEVHVTPAAPGTPAPATGASPSSSSSPAPSVRLLGEDIRYIKNPAQIAPQRPPLVRQGWFVLLNVAAFLGLVGLSGWRTYKKVFHSDERLMRFRKAEQRAKEARIAAEASLNQGEMKAAVSRAGQALREFLAAKLGQNDERSISLKEAMNALRARGVNPHRAEKVRNLWESLDLYQFAPLQAKREEVHSTLATFDHVIDELDKELTWKI